MELSVFTTFFVTLNLQKISKHGSNFFNKKEDLIKSNLPTHSAQKKPIQHSISKNQSPADPQ